jgi:hypothetical protein
VRHKWIVLVFASIFLAKSQPPSPTSTPSAHTQQNKTPSKKAVIFDKQQPSEPSPSDLNKTNANSTGGDQKSDDKQNKQATPSDYKLFGAGVNDWLIVGFTGALSVYLLVCNFGLCIGKPNT